MSQKCGKWSIRKYYEQLIICQEITYPRKYGNIQRNIQPRRPHHRVIKKMGTVTTRESQAVIRNLPHTPRARRLPQEPTKYLQKNNHESCYKYSETLLWNHMILIPNPEKDTGRKVETDIPEEHRCKNP